MNYSNFTKSIKMVLLFLVLTTNLLFSQSIFFNPDTVKATKFDMGKMWTFEDAPIEYFDSVYQFKPNEDWLQKVRLSALKFGSWCSASFVSADGLVMTNHHCVDFITSKIEEAGENIATNGFYAQTLAGERKVPGLFVDQLVLIEDVTDEINSAIEEGKSIEEKTKKKSAKIKEIEKRFVEETQLVCKVTELYQGGKYSLYGYRRYEDVRMVLVNERQVGLYGGDPDNFTYPRYDADFAFLRVYEDGKPLKTDNFFKWSPNGAVAGEPIFVIGNPGSTDRLKTVAQMEFDRDFTYRLTAYLLSNNVKILLNEMKLFPEKKAKLEGTTFFLANSAKVYEYIYKSLQDPYLIARKKSFERDFQAKVKNNSELSSKYGHLWEALAEIQQEYRKYSGEIFAYAINPRLAPVYFNLASKMVSYAKQMQLPEQERDAKYKGENIEKTKQSIITTEIDDSVELQKLAIQIDVLNMALDKNNWIISNFLAMKTGKNAAQYLLGKSSLTSKEKITKFLELSPEEILDSNDPFIQFILNTQDKLAELKKINSETAKTEEVLLNTLGRAVYDVFGTDIPPDATFTLRISDGVMKGYNYNGTVAPYFTTFYGLYDRFNSHNKEYPWNLPERWAKPHKDMNLATPYNFVSTNDIVGGSSGSPVINKNGEIVGIAFDGNIESLPGSFLYTTEANRTVSVASEGIIELLNTILEAKRLSAELEKGEIPTDYK